MEVERARPIGRPGAEKPVGKESIPGLLRHCTGRPRSMHLPGGHLWARTSENFSSRNCLINQTGPEMGCQEQLRGGSRTPNIAVLNRRDAGPGCFYAFIRQFLEGKFCELRIDGVLGSSRSRAQHLLSQSDRGYMLCLFTY